MTVRQLDIELVAVGPSHAEQLRTIWLEMLVGSPGLFYEGLDEALMLGTDQWRERAAQLSTRTSTLIAAVRNGAFVGMIGGYVDHAGVENEGHAATFHIASVPAASVQTRARVASMLLAEFARWLVDRGVMELFIGVREDQVATLDQLLGLGFVPTGKRRVSELDADFDEVELVCMVSALAYENVLHPTSGVRRPSSPGEYRYRVV